MVIAIGISSQPTLRSCHHPQHTFHHLPWLLRWDLRKWVNVSGLWQLFGVECSFDEELYTTKLDMSGVSAEQASRTLGADAMII